MSEPAPYATKETLVQCINSAIELTKKNIGTENDGMIMLVGVSDYGQTEFYYARPRLYRSDIPFVNAVVHVARNQRDTPWAFTVAVVMNGEIVYLREQNYVYIPYQGSSIVDLSDCGFVVSEVFSGELDGLAEFELDKANKNDTPDAFDKIIE